MVQKWATKRELKVPRNALTGKGINLPAWRFPAIGSVLPSVSISAQGASICITNSCAFKQVDLWSYDWSMTIVMQSEKTLRYDVSTCFDFLFWEIEEQQLAKRTKVCSFDSFSGKYRNKNWSRSFWWCNSNFSGFDFVFMEKYDLFSREIAWDLQAQTCPLKFHLKPRLDESELLFPFPKKHLRLTAICSFRCLRWLCQRQMFTKEKFADVKL